MRVLRRAGAALLVLAAAAGPRAAAQEPSFRAEVDARKLGVQDQVQLTLTLEGASVDLGIDVAPPPLQNLRIVAGPMVSTQVSFVNGAVSQAKVVTYVLQPIAVGRAEVGAARAKLQSGDKTTAPIALEVVAGSILSRGSRPGSPFGREPFADDPFESMFRGRRARGPAPKILVEAVPSRTRLHVGEPLLLTYYIYTQTSITDLQFSEPPKYPGFWSEDLEKPKSSPTGEPATVEGERYQRFAFLQKLLFPTRAGSLDIPAATLRLGLQRGFFDVAGGRAERSTRPLAITVEPIPDEAGFSGAVGHFRASATADKATVPFGEAATIRFRVEGSGNLKWIDRGPELSVPGAKVYPPQVKSDLTAGPSGMSGSKTWEYVVIPETAGVLEVPPLTFSYFDPQAGRIMRPETSALPLRVDAAPGGSAPAAPAVAAGPARLAGPLALRSDLDRPARWLPEPGGRLLALAVALAVLLHAAIGAASWWSSRRRPVEGRGSVPRRSLRGALADLERAGRDGMSKEASAALIEKTLHDVFGAVGDDPSAVRPGDDRARAAHEVLAEVRFLRYAPQLGDYTEKIRDVATRAAEVVRRWA